MNELETIAVGSLGILIGSILICIFVLWRDM